MHLQPNKAAKVGDELAFLGKGTRGWQWTSSSLASTARRKSLAMVTCVTLTSLRRRSLTGGLQPPVNQA